MVGNLVLPQHVNGTVKLDFQQYIQQSTSTNKYLEYGYLHSNALLGLFTVKILCFQNYVRGQGHSDQKMVCDAPPFQDASTNQICNSYLKEYGRYAPDTIILKTRSKVQVSVTGKLYATLSHPKIHSYTKFGIPISKNTGDKHQTQCQF